MFGDNSKGAGVTHLLNKNNVTDKDEVTKNPYGYRPLVYIYGSKDEKVYNEEGGYWTQTTTDSSKLSTPVMYNADKDETKTLLDYGATPDYIRKLRNFSKSINKVNDETLRNVSDPNNAQQINSIADVFSYGVSNVVNGIKNAGVPGLIGGLIDTKNKAQDFINTKTIEPVKQGNFGVAFINAMVNLGETMDYITGTALVKSTAQNFIIPSWNKSFIENGSVISGNSQSTYLDTIIDNIGNAQSPYVWDYKNGRPNYDWNTGSIVSDLALEIISDPTTYLSFGTSAAIKDVAKKSVDTFNAKLLSTSVDGAIDVTAKEAMYSACTKAMEDSIIRAISSAPETKPISDVLTEAAFKTITSSDEYASLVNNTLNRYIVDINKLDSVEDITEDMLINMQTKLKNVSLDIQQSILSDIKTVVNSDVMSKQIDYINKTSKSDIVANTVQKEMFNATLLPTAMMPLAVAHYISKGSGHSSIMSLVKSVLSKSELKLSNFAKHLISKIDNKYVDGVHDTDDFAKDIDLLIDTLAKEESWDSAEIKDVRNHIYSIIKKQKYFTNVTDLEQIIETGFKSKNKLTADDITVQSTKEALDVIKRIDEYIKTNTENAYSNLLDYVNDIDNMLGYLPPNIISSYKSIAKVYTLLQKSVIDNAYDVSLDGLKKIKEVIISDVDDAYLIAKNSVDAIIDSMRLIPTATNNAIIDSNITQLKLLSNDVDSLTSEHAISVLDNIIKSISEHRDSFNYGLVECEKVSSSNTHKLITGALYNKEQPVELYKLSADVAEISKSISDELDGYAGRVHTDSNILKRGSEAVQENIEYTSQWDVKLSNYTKLANFMSNTTIEEIAKSIESGSVLGAILESTNTVDSLTVLKTLKSFNLFKTILDEIESIPNEVLPTEYKLGIYEYFINNSTVTKIYDIDEFTANIAMKACKYKSFVTDASRPHITPHINSYKTLIEIINKQETIKKLKYGSRAMLESIDNDKINVLYSATPGVGGIASISFVVLKDSDVIEFSAKDILERNDIVSFALTDRVKNIYYDVATPYIKDSKLEESFYNCEQYTDIISFDKAIINFIKSVQAEGFKGDIKKGVRLIGYSNSIEYLGTDAMLSSLSKSNRASLYFKDSIIDSLDSFTVSTVDLEDILFRAMNEGTTASGVPFVNKWQVFELIKPTMVKLKQYLDSIEYNMPDVSNSRVSLSKAINTSLPFKKVDLIPKFDDSVTKAIINLITYAERVYGENTAIFEEYSGVLNTLKEEIYDVMVFNQVYEDSLDISMWIKRNIPENNLDVMVPLYRATKDVLPAGTLSLRSMYDIELVRKYCNKGLYNSDGTKVITDAQNGKYNFIFTNDKLLEFTKWFKTADSLLDASSNPYVINTLTSEKNTNIINEMCKSIKICLKQAMEKDLSEAELRVIIDAYNTFDIIMHSVTTKNRARANILKLVVITDAFINNNRVASILHDNKIASLGIISDSYTRYLGNYIPNIKDSRSLTNRNPHLKVLQSYYYSEESDIIQQVMLENKVSSMLESADNIIEQSRINSMLSETNNWDNYGSDVQRHMIRVWRDFLNSVNYYISTAKHDFFKAEKDLPKDNLSKLYELNAYNKGINKLMNLMNTVALHGITSTMDVITAMDSSAEYLQYLIKYCKGRQIIYTGADVFKYKKSIAFLEKLDKHITEGYKYGIRSKRVDDKILIWIDNDYINRDVVKHIHSSYKLPEMKFDKYIYTNKALVRFLEAVDSATDNGFSYSRYSALTEFHIDEIDKFFESNGVSNIISKNHFIETNTLVGAFNHTVIGDYGDGVGEIFSKTSRNPFTSIASGFNSVYSRLVTKENYIRSMLTWENSLRNYFVDIVNNIPESLEKRVTRLFDYLKTGESVIVKYVNDRIVLEPVENIEKLYKLYKITKPIDSNYFVLPYNAYVRLAEFINDNTINSNVYDFLVRYYTAPYKIGQLSTIGWVARNIIDSHSKSIMQSGNALYALEDFKTTQMIAAKYTRTLAMLHKETFGNTSSNNVTKFFLSHKGDNTILNRTMFDKVHAFYNSSAASPTAIQLELMKDVKTTVKSMLKEIEDITQEDIDKFMKVYDNSFGLSETEFIDKIKEVFAESPKKARYLGTLIYKLPAKQKDFVLTKMPVIKQIMNLNSKVEEFIRLHTYLVNNVYNTQSSNLAVRYVDESQFNFTRNSKVIKALDSTFFPFAQFAFDNVLFYLEQIGSNTTLQKLMYQGMPEVYQNDEDYVTNITKNMSYLYAVTNGNVMLPDNVYLKTNFSLYSALNFVVAPVDSVADMLHISVKSAQTLLDVIYNTATNSDYLSDYFDELEELQDKYYNGGLTNEEFTRMKQLVSKHEVILALADLIPVIGVTLNRTAKLMYKSSMGTTVLQRLFPSIYTDEQVYSDNAGWIKGEHATILAALPILNNFFGGVKNDERPVGEDWYDQDIEYRRTHKYVKGVSYVPGFLSKDPATYISTYDRLVDLGYTKDEAWNMMQEGWYYDADASTFYNSIATYTYYIIKDGYKNGISEKDIELYRKQGYVIYTNEQKIPYWLVKDSDVYERTYKALERKGYKPDEILGKMIDGWWLAIVGDLKYYGDAIASREKAYSQYKKFKEGKAAFPSDYISKIDISEDGITGKTFAEKWYEKNGIEYTENMWFNPETGEIYFKGSDDNYYRQYTKKYYPKKTYTTARSIKGTKVYHKKYYVKTTPTKIPRAPRVKNTKAYEIFTTHRKLRSMGLIKDKSIRFNRAKSRFAKNNSYNPARSRVRLNKSRRTNRQYRYNTIRIMGRY